MSRPRLLDLFCCEGGAGTGYARAGFEVVGVDSTAQPRYPFEFHQADALEFLAAHGSDFDAIHASPPCQAYTKGARRWGTESDHADLVGPTRDLLLEVGRPWVLENVEQAPVMFPVVLCGTMFGRTTSHAGLVRELQRHRLFETSQDVPLQAPGPCRHRHQAVPVTGNPGGRSTRDGISFPGVAGWRELMGMDWASIHGLSQAIPPAYTEHIGAALLAALDLEDAAA